MTSLTAKDYGNILDYYKINSKGKTRKERRTIAEKLLAKKLCRCIQKVKAGKGVPLGIKAKQKTRRRGRAIGICRDAVIKRKGYRIKTFSCKKRAIIKDLRKNII